MMNNNGLYIKEFEARGENVSTSKLTFQKGCNVVLGKSDTGKTTLYSITLLSKEIFSDMI